MRITSTYKKYIAKSIVPPMFLLAFILTTLTWITQILRLLPLIDRGLRFKDFFQLIILFIPYLLFMILPIISVVSTLYIYGKLQNERQIIVLRSSGLNNFALLKPALFVSVITTIFAFYLSMYLMPLSYGKLKEGLDDFKQGYVSNLIEAKTFNQISKETTIFVENKKAGNLMENLVIFNNKEPHEKEIIFAKKGKIINSEHTKTRFELLDGLRQAYDNKGKMTKLYFDNLSVVIEPDSKKVNSRKTATIELYIHELIWPDKNLRIDRQNRLITDGHLRIVWPMFNFAFVFLGLSIFLNYPFNRREKLKQYLYTIAPILCASYFHFTLQKFAHKNIEYIFLCYVNVFVCIIFSTWQSTKNSI